MSILKILNYIRVALVIVIPFTVLAEQSGRPGPEKKKMAVEKLKESLKTLGFIPPQWLQPYEDAILGAIVDVIVEILNRLGFFEHGTKEVEATQ